MSEELTEVRVGRSVVKFGGVELGFTEGESTITYTPEFRDFMSDQNTGVLKKFLIGEALAIAIPMAQSLARSLARAKAFALGELKATALGGGGSSTQAGNSSPGGTIISVQAGQGASFTAGNFVLLGTGLVKEMGKIDSIATDDLTLTEPMAFAHSDTDPVLEVDPEKTRIAVGNPAGSLEAPTASLELIPLDGSDPVLIYKVQVGDELEIVLQKAEETVVEVPFTALMDTSRAQGDQLMTIGDKSVV